MELMIEVSIFRHRSRVTELAESKALGHGAHHEKANCWLNASFKFLCHSLETVDSCHLLVAFVPYKILEIQLAVFGKTHILSCSKEVFYLWVRALSFDYKVKSAAIKEDHT